MARRAKLIWHEEVLDAAGLRTAGRIASVADGFYLAGGTGLALRLGHRVSLDLDLFSRERPLGAPERLSIVRSLEASGPVEVRDSSDGTLHLVLGATRASFLRYRYPLLEKPDFWKGLAVAAPEDIAAMKIAAIIGRGAKKDFLDLHALASRGDLERMLRAAAKKYSAHSDFLLQAARALVFFDDAEKDPMPRLLADVGWDEIKARFERDVPRILRRILG